MIGTPVSRRETLSAILAGSISVFGVTTASARDAVSEDDSNRYIVGTASGAATRAVSSSASSIHRTLEFGRRGHAVVGEFSDDALEKFRSRSDVRYVEKDHTRYAIDLSPTENDRQTADDPIYVESVPAPGETRPAARSVDPSSEQTIPWGIERIGAEGTEDKDESGRGASVAVLDTGIDPAHESLEVTDGLSLAECSGSDCETEWADEGGHGTHCAGTACAVDNGVGVVGANPNAELYAVKVLAGDGSGSDSDIAAGIEWCAEQGIDVINLSLGGPEPGPVLEDALEYAYERGVLVVAAAGNYGPDEDTVDYPAKYDPCIAVGATDSRDEVAQFSARGDGVELVAPGVDITSTHPGDEYEELTGSSMAAPHVAGVAAQLMAHGIPNAEDTEDVDDPGGARGILRETAEDLGEDDSAQGYGLLNAAEAYQQIEPVSVEDVTDVRASTATLVGRLHALADADEADVAFQWRETDTSDWHETDAQTRTDRGTFDTELTDLESETGYEVRVTLESSAESATSEVLSFTTGIDDLVVETGDVTALDHQSVACIGELPGLGDAEAAEVAFEWREGGDDEWTATASQDRGGVGEFDDEVNGLEPETDYEVRAVGEVDGDTDAGETVSVTTDPEPGLPEIEAFEISDSSSQNFVQATVEWVVTDQDDDLEELTTELRDAEEGELIHSVTSELEGGEEGGSHTVRNTDRVEGAGEEYEITITVSDGEDNVTEDSQTVRLDERSPPPSVDRFEVTPDDFVGRPRVEVEWAVSDEGGELWDLELELHADDEVVDETSSMCRGDEQTGRDTLTAPDEDSMGGEFDVTIVVTDYFDQTTTETTRVTIDD